MTDEEFVRQHYPDARAAIVIVYGERDPRFGDNDDGVFELTGYQPDEEAAWKRAREVVERRHREQ